MTTNYLACGGPVCSQAATVNLLQSWWTTIKGARSKCNRYFSGMLLYHWWCFSLQGNNNILRDEGWKPLTAAHCRPQIWYRTHQNSNSTQFIQGFTVQGNKTSTICWSGGRVQVLVQVWAPLPAITPEGYSRRQSKFLTEQSMAKLLGQCSAALLRHTFGGSEGSASTLAILN